MQDKGTREIVVQGLNDFHGLSVSAIRRLSKAVRTEAVELVIAKFVGRWAELRGRGHKV